MCVLVVKNVGVERPTTEQFNAMMKANPNGFGLATIIGGKLVVQKTMDNAEYLQMVSKVTSDMPAIFHMRIATHGSIQTKNCHPFLSECGTWAFAHNGILGIRNEGDMTDSETYFKRIAMPFLRGGYTPDNPHFTLMENAIRENSKFAYLNNKGELYHSGHFIKDCGGLLFSNLSYVVIPSWNKDILGCGQDDDDDNDVWESKITTSKAITSPAKSSSDINEMIEQQLLKDEKRDSLIDELSSDLYNDAHYEKATDKLCRRYYKRYHKNYKEFSRDEFRDCLNEAIGQQYC